MTGKGLTVIQHSLSVVNIKGDFHFVFVGALFLLHLGQGTSCTDII